MILYCGHTLICTIGIIFPVNDFVLFDKYKFSFEYTTYLHVLTNYFAKNMNCPCCTVCQFSVNILFHLFTYDYWEGIKWTKLLSEQIKFSAIKFDFLFEWFEIGAKIQHLITIIEIDWNEKNRSHNHD